MLHPRLPRIEIPRRRVAYANCGEPSTKLDAQRRGVGMVLAWYLRGVCQLSSSLQHKQNVDVLTFRNKVGMMEPTSLLNPYLELYVVGLDKTRSAQAHRAGLSSQTSPRCSVARRHPPRLAKARDPEKFPVAKSGQALVRGLRGHMSQSMITRRPEPRTKTATVEPHSDVSWNHGAA
jgi:hypothetical protein